MSKPPRLPGAGAGEAEVSCGDGWVVARATGTGLTGATGGGATATQPVDRSGALRKGCHSKRRFWFLPDYSEMSFGYQSGSNLSVFSTIVLKVIS